MFQDWPEKVSSKHFLQCSESLRNTVITIIFLGCPENNVHVFYRFTLVTFQCAIFGHALSPEYNLKYSTYDSTFMLLVFGNTLNTY